MIVIAHAPTLAEGLDEIVQCAKAIATTPPPEPTALVSWWGGTHGVVARADDGTFLCALGGDRRADVG